MKATIVNCFDTYEERVDLIHEFFKRQGYDVTVIQSDFRHFKKVHRTDEKEGFIFVKSKPYYKNLSVSRLTSHYKYASEAFEIVKTIKPDLLYVFVPPNSLAKFAAEYKKNNKDTKLIYDLIDLWPETMPIGKAKKFPPFTYWGAMRDNSLQYADLLITECDLYQTVLSDSIEGIRAETVHLAKKEIKITSKPNLSGNEIQLAYLGSINNIIDIPKIKEIVQVIRSIKPVTLHIIGDGESKEELINEVKSAGGAVEYHGKIYDPQEKQYIFDKCHFGLNIMKESVCVGLTMKSIDYFQHGLPIINNIPADTTWIIEKFGVGINISNSQDIEANLAKITNLDNEAMLDMRKETLSIYKGLFSVEAYFNKVESVYKEHINL